MAPCSKTLIPLSPTLVNRCPQCLHVHYNISRQFGFTPSSKAMAAGQQTKKDLVSRMESRKSRRVEMKKMAGSKIPDDLGLIPQTFIRPANSEMPRLLSSKWKSRLKLEWLWLRTRFQNFGSLVYFIWWSQRKLPKSERMPLQLAYRKGIALEMQKIFYTSLAAADFPAIRPLLCAGLANTIQSRIKLHNESMSPPESWKIVRYTSPIRLKFTSPYLLYLYPFIPFTQAKIMSDRVVPFPVGQNIYLRQCIVRICSRQSLDKKDGNPPAQANLTEYIVMQQMNRDPGEPVKWKLWGTTKPTSRQEMEKLVDVTGGEEKMTLLDRLKTADPTRGV